MPLMASHLSCQPAWHWPQGQQGHCKQWWRFAGPRLWDCAIAGLHFMFQQHKTSQTYFFGGKEEGFDGVSGLGFVQCQETLQQDAFFIPLTDRAQWKEQGHRSQQLCKANSCFPACFYIDFSMSLFNLGIHRLAWPQRLVAIASRNHCWLDQGYRTPKKTKPGSPGLWHNSTKNLFLNTY